MTNRKSQNSILFLATLGVYLGLVLTGATPVLGHAATSRQFDIKEEIEFSDEFDNKPDDDKELPTYVAAVESIRISADKVNGTIPWLFEKARSDRGTYFGKNTVCDFEGCTSFGNSVSEKYYSQVRSHIDAPDLDIAQIPRGSGALLPTLKLNRIPDALGLSYDGRQLSHKDAHLFIVTRLPRAGLDSLLIPDAK